MTRASRTHRSSFTTLLCLEGPARRAPTSHFSSTARLRARALITRPRFVSTHIAGARTPDKATRLKALGVEVRALDYLKPETVVAIFADADSGVRRGELDDTSRVLSTLIGRPTTRISTVLAKALGVSA